MFSDLTQFSHFTVIFHRLSFVYQHRSTGFVYVCGDIFFRVRKKKKLHTNICKTGISGVLLLNVSRRKTWYPIFCVCAFVVSFKTPFFFLFLFALFLSDFPLAITKIGICNAFTQKWKKKFLMVWNNFLSVQSLKWSENDIQERKIRMVNVTKWWRLQWWKLMLRMYHTCCRVSRT